MFGDGAVDVIENFLSLGRHVFSMNRPRWDRHPRLFERLGHLNVAIQVSNLLYRRFPIGRAVHSSEALEAAKRLRVGNPRYSRFGNLYSASSPRFWDTQCVFHEA